MSKSPQIKILVLLLVIEYLSTVKSQVGFAQLSKIGIIKGKAYNLKIKGKSTNQLMVVRFIPNITNITQCTQGVIDDYKSMLDRILLPINDSLSTMKSYYRDKTGGVRFIGAVLGGVALGVATAAQITAGFALHNSIQNAKAIRDVKNAIRESNKAIEKIEQAGRQTITAINAMQDQINLQIIPTFNKLGCEVAKNTLGLRLTQYFSEISLVFGPNLRDPSTETISIQVLSKSFNNDFEAILKTLGYKRHDLLDLLESDLIRARIIDVDLEGYFISLQIEYPMIQQIPDATVQSFSRISFNEKGTEWVSVFPLNILVRGSLLSNIDLTKCTQTTKSYICQQDTSTPMSPSLMDCVRGSTGDCARERVVTSHVPRYALSDGVIFANCMATTCVCETKNHNIIQDTAATSTMITSEFCPQLFIDGVYIDIGPKHLNRTYYSKDVVLGEPVTTDPIDIGNQLAKAEQSLNEAKKHLAKSDSILNRVNPNIVNSGSMVAIIILCVILLVWGGISLIWLIVLTRKVDNYPNQVYGYNSTSTINSLSSLIPGT